MPSFENRRGRVRVRIMVDGRKATGTFGTKRQAAQWALQQQAELSGAKLPDKSLGDALRRFADEKAPSRKGGRWEVVRCQKLERELIADRMLPRLAGPDFAAWRDLRLKEVGPASVKRELGLMHAVLRSCVRDWGWLRANPLQDVDRPRAPASRKRRISQAEVDRLELALGLGDGLVATTAMQRTGLAFLLALETAMRSSEILGLCWEDVGEKSVTLATTKNGDVRRVPLSARAREIMAALPRDSATCFNLEAGTRDALFRRARDAAGIANLHFHDSRAEAIFRLSKKLDVLELARIIGHRDIRSLMIYYETDADELADRL